MATGSLTELTASFDVPDGTALTSVGFTNNDFTGGGTSSIFDGRLKQAAGYIPAALAGGINPYALVSSSLTYSITGSSVYARVTLPPSGAGDFSTYMMVNNQLGYGWRMRVLCQANSSGGILEPGAGQMYFDRISALGGSGFFISTSYNSASHRWWRLRGTATASAGIASAYPSGLIYAEYAPDGDPAGHTPGTWTTWLATSASNCPEFARGITSSYVSFVHGKVGAHAATVAYWDGVNTNAGTYLTISTGSQAITSGSMTKTGNSVILTLTGSSWVF